MKNIEDFKKKPITTVKKEDLNNDIPKMGIDYNQLMIYPE